MKYNFKMLKKEFIDDICSEGSIYEHTSGAKLVFVKNDDDNKVFSVTFKTLPENNCGTAHIMEHSVLCGSRKYPVKDPFNQLEKGSLNTYLNAMTFIDKTMYPVASTNEKDFINLINVYMDAVFFPLIYERKGIFLQEGHHLEKNGVNGVVYNEMKGVFSSPDRILELKLNEVLFNDTAYKFYSGGVPEAIPNLSYEEFLNFHKKYYHPANSIIYLYGDLDIEKYLEFIDRDYLSEFQKNDIKTEYKIQKDFDNIIDAEFEYNANENENGKNYLECGVIIGKGNDYELSLAFEILTDVLLETEASPLKKALIENGIGDNVYGSFDDSMYQTMFSVIAEKSKIYDLKLFRKVIFDTLKSLVENGIDKRLIKSCINKYKFYLKEKDFGYRPKGLYYNIIMIKSFVYGEGDFDALKFDRLFDRIEKVSFENLIDEYILKNKNQVYALLKPAKKTESSFDGYFEEDAEIEKYRAIKDKDEDIEKIPLIDLRDIDRNIKKIDIFEENTFGARVISSYTDNDDIVYVNLMFDTRYVDYEDVKYIGLLKYMLGKLNTKNFDYTSLSNEINYYFGDFKTVFNIYDVKDDFLPVLSIDMKFLKENTEKVFSLAEEIIFNTIFDKKRVRELVFEYKSLMEKGFISNGHSYAISRCISYFSDKKKYSENISGIEFYNFLRNLSDNFDSEIDTVIENIRGLIKAVFKRENLICGTVCGRNNYKMVYGRLEKLYLELDGVSGEKKEMIFCNEFRNEAFITGSNVQFNVLAADFIGAGFEYDGKFALINKIINSDYLWNKVRVEGGAYGGGCSLNRNGNMYLYSYRDPNVKKTFEYYRGIPRYLENINISERELKKYIIGAINILDKPIKPGSMIDIILYRKLSSLSDDIRQKEREEILDFNKSNFSLFADIFERCIAQNYICSFGSESEIVKEKDIFDFIKNMK